MIYNIIKYETMFKILFGIVTASYVLAYVNFIGSILDTLQKIALIMLVALPVIFSQKYPCKMFITFILTFGVLLVGYVYNRNLAILILFAVVWAAMPIEPRKIIEFDFKLRIVLCIFVVICYFANLTEVYTMVRGENETIRTDLGFGHPNTVGLYVLLFCIEFCFLKGKRLKYYDVALMLVLILVADSLCDSRAAISLSILTVIASYMNKYVVKIAQLRIVQLCTFFIYPFFTLITYILMKLYRIRNSFAVDLDMKLSRRIKFCGLFMERYGVHLFGSNITLVGTKGSDGEAWVLDNTYFYLLIRFGIIAWLIIFLSYVLLFKWIFDMKKYEYFAPTIIILTQGFVSVSVVSLKFNVFFIIIAYVGKEMLGSNYSLKRFFKKVYKERLTIKSQE